MPLLVPPCVSLPRLQRFLSTSAVVCHENPLGLPKRSSAPQFPRRSGPIAKRHIPNVKKVVVVASGKGGVGKSTVAVNLAFAMALLHHPTSNTRPRVGILDLDIFGPSIPTLMGLQNSGEPELTSSGAILPLTNHGLPCMSMGFLLPTNPSATDNSDTPVVWRGLMVQKAVQQLLFDVDWSSGGEGLDVLVIDMPPGTGDVPLTLGQLVKVDGSVIISTPQDVALSDVRKGIAMLRKVEVPITGLVLNQAYYLCPTCPSPSPQFLFGKPNSFRSVANRLSVPILAELPLVQDVSSYSDNGRPYALATGNSANEGGSGGVEWKGGMKRTAESVISAIGLWQH